MNTTPLTLMTVHAHPDDEVVFTGGLLALAHDRGIRTVLICGTGGEEGEIHDPDLDPEAARPDLASHRKRELDGAVAALQIDHLEMLGYRDSGMEGTEPNARPDNFHNADPAEALARVVRLIRQYQPQVLVTYNDFGAYGHPDHIAAHKVTMAAWEVAGDPAYRPDLGPAWTPLKLYYCAWNEEGWKEAKAEYEARGLEWPFDRRRLLDEDAEHPSTEVSVEKAAEEE
jgi:LmbE family N-acetylglucosaminyl deacetylase